MRFAAQSEKIGTVPDDATVDAHVGIGPRTFQPQSRQQRRTVARADELKVAAAFGFEGRFHGRTGTPVRGKAVVGIDGQGFRVCCGGQ